MTGNRALLTNFVKKFLRMVRFGNNDFAVIAGYGDVVIGSMTIKKVYYVQGLGHNLFCVGQFCDKGLEVAFRKSTCFVRNEDGVDLLTGDRSSNLYTIALNEVASNSLTCRYYSTIFCCKNVKKNGVVERRNRTLVEAARTMLTFANLPLFLWAEAITTACFTQNRSIIHKRFDKTPYELMNKRKPNIKFFCVFGCRCYLLNDYEDVGKLKAKGDIGVFVGYSKESAAFRIYNKRTRKIHESVNIMKSSTTNFETSINKEVFHEVSESFQGECSSSSLNDDVQQSPKETKDHPLHKIIGDPKSSVRTRGQLANSCLFSCLLSSIEPANVAEALKDVDWVSAMQDELDQFTRLKVWRLVPRPEGKTIIKTKWIFKNKKDESSLVIQNKARLVAVGYC
uniref:Retrovirus-related Pol polyprotein from transposon TNT 1-94 n=1 Tax=Tanacetum cinerariifolium TaxID=118510 RepID=A0A699IE97_TANCI|nr:retrovirus-related Pol polyprotein from transposon TNT 1-94 [Tanacetum cinerariifolium]